MSDLPLFAELENTVAANASEALQQVAARARTRAPRPPMNDRRPAPPAPNGT